LLLLPDFPFSLLPPMGSEINRRIKRRSFHYPVSTGARAAESRIRGQREDGNT